MVNWLTHEFLLSPSFSWRFVPSPLISLFLVLNSAITLEHEVKSSLSISPCHDQDLTPTTAYIEYSIHRVLHHPNTDCLPLPASLSSPGRPYCTQFSTFPQLQVNQWIESQLPWCLPPSQTTASRLTDSKYCSNLARPWPPSVSPNSLHHTLQVNLQTRTMTDSKFAWSQHSKCMSKLGRSWPQSASPNLLDYGLQVHPQLGCITASKCISKLARLRPPSSHHHCLKVQLRTGLIMISECISKFTWSRPPNVSPNTYNHTLQVYFQTCSITASKFAWSRPSKCISKLGQ